MSSAATTSASCSACTSRIEASPALPSGVAASKIRPPGPSPLSAAPTGSSCRTYDARVAVVTSAPDRALASLPDRLAPAMPSHGWRGWVGPLGAGALAALTRLPNLGRPDAVVFDETYYAKDAWSLLRFGVEIDEVENHKELMMQAGDNWRTVEAFSGEPAFIVHPPVGKWTIAIGEYFFGVTPFGWRIAIAILAIIAVVITARIVRRLTRSDVLGTIAGGLLALEGIHIVLARTALLDLVLGFWVLVGFGFLLLDRDRTRGKAAALDQTRRRRSHRDGPWPLPRLAPNAHRRDRRVRARDRHQVVRRLLPCRLHGALAVLGRLFTQGDRSGPSVVGNLRPRSPARRRIHDHRRHRGLPTHLDRLVRHQHRVEPQLGSRPRNHRSFPIRSDPCGTTTRRCGTSIPISTPNTATKATRGPGRS